MVFANNDNSHAIWNIAGVLLPGGVNPAEGYPYILMMQASADTVLSGGDYKIEASIVTLILNLILMVVFYPLYQKEEKRFLLMLKRFLRGIT